MASGCLMCVIDNFVNIILRHSKYFYYYFYQITNILPDEDDVVISTLKFSNNFDSNSNFAIVFLQTMWNQTVPLFQRRYLLITIIICNIQFWLFVITNGLYMWFPHIINSMAAFMQEHPGEHRQICEIVYAQEKNLYKNDGVSKIIFIKIFKYEEETGGFLCSRNGR